MATTSAPDERDSEVAQAEPAANEAKELEPCRKAAAKAKQAELNQAGRTQGVRRRADAELRGPERGHEPTFTATVKGERLAVTSKHGTGEAAVKRYEDAVNNM